MYAGIATAFYEFFHDPSQRDGFYAEVVAHSKSLPNGHDVWQSFDEFENLLKQRCSNWTTRICPILISMDEIHVLFNPRGHETQQPYTLYSRLKSVLSEALTKDLCTIFLSTTTRLAKLPPSKDVAPSIRERDDERILPVPFTELPFDVHIISEPLAPGRESLTSVGTLAFTARFGRPL